MSVIRTALPAERAAALDDRVTVHVLELTSMSFTMSEIAAAWRRCMETMDDALDVIEARE